MAVTEHVGASESWSPRAELDAVGLSPELVTESDLTTEARDALDGIESAFVQALDDVTDRALARLEQAGVTR